MYTTMAIYMQFYDVECKNDATINQYDGDEVAMFVIKEVLFHATTYIVTHS